MQDREPQHSGDADTREQQEEFGELLLFTGSGFLGGLALAGILDAFGLQRSAVGQWVVRTLAGEGESIAEGAFAVRKRLRASPGSMAQAYGWGKMIGLAVPWVIDWGSRWSGVDVNAVSGFYVPYFYAMSDQIGGNVSGFMHLRRRSSDLRGAAARYVRDPLMISGLLLILLVPLGLLAARGLGFRPDTQLFTALETIAANLCWVPPLVAWFFARKTRGQAKEPP